MSNTEIFDRFFQGKTSIEEEKELFLWLNQDVNHVRQFLHARKNYDLILLADEKIAIPGNIDVDVEYKKLKEYIQKEKALQQEEHRKIKRTKSLKYLKQAVAYAAILVGMAFIIHRFSPEDELFPPATSTAEIQIPEKNKSYMPQEPQNCKVINTNTKNKRRITLPDNTVVWINSKSKLKYPPEFEGKLREVWLEGEAYFEVSHNPDKQFIVHTLDFDINVFGTSFNVSAYNDHSNKSYTLTEGSIKLTSNTDIAFNELYLTPGQQVNYNSGKIEIKEVNPSLEAAWREGKFYFREKSFSEICHQLEIAFDVTIRIDGDDLKKSTYTGDFIRNESLEEILSIMSSDERMEYKMNGKIITIKEN